jgi:hypothetical protein
MLYREFLEEVRKTEEKIENIFFQLKGSQDSFTGINSMQSIFEQEKDLRRHF